MKIDFNKLIFNMGMWTIFLLLFNQHIHNPSNYSTFILTLIILVSLFINSLKFAKTSSKETEK